MILGHGSGFSHATTGQYPESLCFGAGFIFVSIAFRDAIFAFKGKGWISIYAWKWKRSALGSTGQCVANYACTDVRQ